ncbi:S-adenosyl-L-methionine-dependent methyltransferase [Delitschia confertaspora ATCC 74209]|uniref:S-adenosyl-L-methionine-dependent methyltransferase n=1 Tax=Delitschia confertaspora ATCC 74209 TaxID=1513339 RepID=A0A9P4MRQ1_9PLEO|nr:S-adenosyl-L-methionine-dependent methyltransferase [Delitschia confertaspora ATCC 74209]
MPTDTGAILELSKTIGSLAQTLDKCAVSNKQVQAALIVAAEKLAIATREPEENVYHIATQIAHNAAIRSIIAMGVFEQMPEDGSPISSSTLASRLNVNEELLIRLLRACTSTHLFANPSPNHYVHTPLSRAYLTPANRAMTAQMYDFTCKGVFALPEFLLLNKFDSAGTYESGAFQMGANTDLTFWDYLAAVPERMQLFSAGMRAATTIGSGRASGAFPFGEALAEDPVANEDDVAVVDVGGGRGQALEAIQRDWPGMKGKLVLQDLPHVVKDAEKKGLPEWMGTSGGSFFEEQKIKGARIYHFRRIFHDWDQIKGRQILENTKAAMNDLSRVIIADMALPDVNAPRDMALQDLNMMSFGGMERSVSQWKDLIESAGLVMKNIWFGKDGAKHAVVEAVLPGFKGHDLTPY